MVPKMDDGDVMSTTEWERCKETSATGLKKKGVARHCGIEL